MPRRTLVVLAVMVALFLSGCVMPGRAPMVLADSDGYTVISPCGDPISTIEVRKSLDPTATEPYWSAEAHVESAATRIRLFSSPAGYASTPVASAMDPRGEYIVWINGVSTGTVLVPGELKPGRGIWFSESFDVANLAKEQKRVADRVCGPA